jgi:hypothetical protein
MHVLPHLLNLAANSKPFTSKRGCIAVASLIFTLSALVLSQHTLLHVQAAAALSGGYIQHSHSQPQLNHQQPPANPPVMYDPKPPVPMLSTKVCITAFSCKPKGWNSSLWAIGALVCSCKLDPTAAIDLTAAKEIRPPGMLRLGMIPAVPKDSLRPIMMNRTPSIVPAGTEVCSIWWVPLLPHAAR